MRLTPDTLRAATGSTAERAALYAAPLSVACDHYGINTPARLAAFLAQIGHESGSLRYAQEVWGPTAAQTRYEGRRDLGNTEPGDGYRYRGRGLLQTTGRKNYRALTTRLRARFPAAPDFEVEPDQLLDPDWAAISAADYWDMRALNALADRGDILAIGRAINRGNAASALPANGEADRMRRWHLARQALAEPSGTTGRRHDDAPTPQPQAPEGVPSATPPHLQEDQTMAPFIAAALPSLIGAIPQLGKLFGSGSAVAARNVQAAELAVQIVQDAVGAKNAQEAAEIVKADPAQAQAAAAAVQQRWYEIAEAGGGGIAGARQADERFTAPDGPRFWHSPAFVVSGLLLLTVYMLLVDVLFVHPEMYSGEQRTQVITAVLGLSAIVGAYWLGSSNGSARKTELNGGKA